MEYEKVKSERELERNFRIIFSDIDGTLLNADRQLSPATIQEIQRIKDRIPVVLVSSRMPDAMVHLQEELQITNQPLICYNGGLVLVDHKVIHSTFISVETIERLGEFNRGKVHLSLYHNNDWFVPEMDLWADREERITKVKPVVKPIEAVVKLWRNEGKGAHKIMCMGEEAAIDRTFGFLSENFENDLHLYRSKPTYLEIAHKSISKLSAAEMLLNKHFKISLSEGVAFGDNFNDIDLLRGLGTGVAVANAKPEVLAIADVITAPGKEDGVAKFLKENILG